MRKIVAFYHLATMGHYKQVDAEILGLVKHSGLLKELDSLKIGVVGNGDIDLLYEDEKMEIKRLDNSVGAYEYPIMKWLREYCFENECYVLYFANVGVSHAKEREDYYPGWRDLCCHFCIMKYKECLKALEMDYNTCSIEWQKYPCPHFSGSFWWAKSEYIKTLPTLEDARTYGNEKIKSKRHGTEFWIGMSDNVHQKTFYQTGHDWRSRPIIDWYKEAMK